MGSRNDQRVERQELRGTGTRVDPGSLPDAFLSPSPPLLSPTKRFPDGACPTREPPISPSRPGSRHRPSVAPPLRGEIIGVLGALGGAENERWLQGVVRDEGTPLTLRRRALQQAARDDRMSSASLAALFDATPERRLRQDLLSLVGRRDERTATDKLLAVTRDPADCTLQRYAIGRLSQSSDPRVREALEGMVSPP